MKKTKWVCAFSVLAFLTLILFLSGQQGPVAAKGAPAVSPYDMDIKPLTTAECGQCHYSIFQAIKQEGARHQIDCVRCHREYHVYSPKKNNYDEIMPKCAWCHQSATGGAFHGDVAAVTSCLGCHVDPHKPKGVPLVAVEAHCNICHGVQEQELKTYPSRHTTEVSCSDCHADKHGYIPECSACHESHSPAVAMDSKACQGCHPVHKPTEMAYSKTTPSAICAGCHQDISDMLQSKVTKHTAVLCADCHTQHAEIPACTRCHPQPHPKELLEGWPECSGCHGDPHDLAT